VVRKIITTADGSHSIYVEGLDENYHSRHGALQESLHVFIKSGLHFLFGKGKREIRILEVGLGTGLNALLTWMEAEELNIGIHYTGLEAFPLDPEILDQLNYPKEITKTNPFAEVIIKTKMAAIHSCDWEKDISLSGNFTLHKIRNTLRDVKFDSSFDLIYFDAFGPRVQPEMWTDEIFLKLFNATNQEGALVTYCSKGEVRRSMIRNGFSVEKLQGPPGKRDMVRAVKP
jgi:tRNA U34 5-methylaminomethyl-2-thiouridine-forming methyltransferase MnmC